MPPDALEILRGVNRTLRSALPRLRPERRDCSTLRPQDLSDLMTQLLQATECLRTVPPNSRDAAPLENHPLALENHSLAKDQPGEGPLEREAFAKEALEYRRHLEDLKHFLPDLQLRLIAERDRLLNARARLSAASAWAEARKKAL